ncbi:MAG TPA: hypothetical protein VK961_26885 [Chthoniobacter sp.]|nr:hypothetical protein [Chthoniobacter sp.]
MASEINGLRNAIVERLAGLEDFADTEVLGNAPGDLANQVAQALASVGIYSLVCIPQGNGSPRQSQRPILDPLSVYVLIREDPVNNQTGKDATFLAERAYAALQWWKPAIDGAYMLTLTPDGMKEVPFRIKDDASNQDMEIHAWELLFHTKLALTPAT